jgi:hypothetical protein
MDLPTEPLALLNDIAGRRFQEPLLSADPRQLPEVMRNVVLLADLDAELHINGLGGFLENSLGGFLPEIILALEAIGARESAEALRSAQVVMANHGITHAMLRADNAHCEEFEVTSFRQAHGEAAAAMLHELYATVDPRLYLNNPDGEDLGQLLQDYVALHLRELRESIEDALRAAAGSG